MPTNDFLPFAAASDANVLPQSTYSALATRPAGFQSGILPSTNLNKPLRQASIMAAVLAQFIADKSGANSVDDGTTATLLANLATAIATVPSGLGVGQTFQDLTSSRAIDGTTYTNSTGRTIFIEVYFDVGAGQVAQFKKGGALIQNFGNNAAVTTSLSFSSIVLPGQTYSVTATATPGYSWHETR